MLAIIGGSGFEQFDGFETVQFLDCDTPFGMASSGLRQVKVNGEDALFVSRHGKDHELLPSEVNFRANLFALKRSGAQAVVSFSATGSLKKDLKPGDMVVPHQYIDRTKGVRKSSYCGEGVVGHVSLAHPVCDVMKRNCQKMTPEKDWDCHFDQTYICVEGPFFSTKAESNLYREMGADIIGMTHFPEYALAREAGLPYLPCCFVTDYDCWDDSIPHVTVQEVIQVMKKNNAKAYDLLQDLVKKGPTLWEGSAAPESGLKNGLLTPSENIPEKASPWISVICED